MATAKTPPTETGDDPEALKARIAELEAGQVPKSDPPSSLPAAPTEIVGDSIKAMEAAAAMGVRMAVEILRGKETPAEKSQGKPPEGKPPPEVNPQPPRKGKFAAKFWGFSDET